MIRAAALILAVVAGMTLAVVLQGRMYHARATLPDLLPPWTGRIADDAGVITGVMHLPGRAGFAPVGIAWKALTPGAGGLRWALKVSGPGIDLQARATVNFALTRLVFDQPGGSADLTGLGPVARDLAGILEVTGLSMMLDDIRGVPRASGTAGGRWRGAGFQGVDLGDGPVRAELDPLGSWRVRFDLEGGVAAVQATLSGRMPRPVLSLDAGISDQPTLPDQWRRGLALAGRKTDGVWRLRQTVRLP